MAEGTAAEFLATDYLASPENAPTGYGRRQIVRTVNGLIADEGVGVV